MIILMRRFRTEGAARRYARRFHDQQGHTRPEVLQVTVGRTGPTLEPWTVVVRLQVPVGPAPRRTTAAR